MKKAVFNDEFYHEIAELTECNCHIEASCEIAKTYFSKITLMEKCKDEDKAYFYKVMGIRMFELAERLNVLKNICDINHYTTDEVGEIHLMYREMVLQTIENVFGEDEYNYVHNCL